MKLNPTTNRDDMGPTNFPRIYGTMNNGGPHRFCYMGENLLHSQHLYYLLYALSEETGVEKYAQEADNAIEDFALHTPAEETGLYPWGEHAQ